MDASDLRYFEVVARLGRMNKAALELNTVQSNVSARIRALELELCAELFYRHSRGVDVTEAGARLLPYATRIASVLAEAKSAVMDDGRPRGRLFLGSLETTAGLRLSPIITAFSRAYSEVDLSLKVGSNEQLIPQVLNHLLDGAFVCGPVQHPDLVAEVVFEEELVIASARSLTFDQTLFVSGRKILVKASGCAYRDRLERLLADLGVSDFSTLEFGTLDAIIGCVEAGLGVTMLPRSVLTSAAEAGRIKLHSLSRGIAHAKTLFVRRRSAHETSAMRAFTEFVRQRPQSLEIKRLRRATPR